MWYTKRPMPSKIIVTIPARYHESFARHSTEPSPKKQALHGSEKEVDKYTTRIHAKNGWLPVGRPNRLTPNKNGTTRNFGWFPYLPEGVAIMNMLPSTGPTKHGGLQLDDQGPAGQVQEERPTLRGRRWQSRVVQANLH